LEQEQQKQRLCDAAQCKEMATEEIKVKAGKFGFVTLYVCEGCVSKFIDE